MAGVARLKEIAMTAPVSSAERELVFIHPPLAT